MSTIDSRGLREPAPAPGPAVEERPAQLAAGGSAIEAAAGIAVVILAILGLAGVLPVTLGAIAFIVLGAALVLEGASMMVRYVRFLEESTRALGGNVDVGGGTSAEFLGGAAAIVLGILALIGLVPTTLIAVAALVMGATVLIGSAANARLNMLSFETFSGFAGPMEASRLVARAAVSAAAGAQILVGLAAIVLGIIALANGHTLTLTLVALLCLGCGVMLSGGALCGKMMTVWQRR